MDDSGQSLECDLRMKVWVKQGGAVAQRLWSSDWTCQKDNMKGSLGFRAPRLLALRESLYFFKMHRPLGH